MLQEVTVILWLSWGMIVCAVGTAFALLVGFKAEYGRYASGKEVSPAMSPIF